MVAALTIFMAGTACGGYLFSRTLPRTFLPWSGCGDHCYTAKEIAGLLASAAVLRLPGLAPGVALESDTCIAFRYPKPAAKAHYVLFPKHDVENITTLTPEDMPYVAGCLSMVRQLVLRDRLRKYFVRTNGPAIQDVAYLHFHLVAE